MGQRSVPAPFLTKTYQLVDDPNTNDVISWSESGNTFVVWKTADFAKDLIPIYFKHNNFSSFVRQLNTYGFRKIVPDKWEFANDNFRRGQKDLLTEILRRKTITSAPAENPTTARKSTAGVSPTSPTNSGEDLGSTSTSSPESKNPGSVDAPMTTTAQIADLSDENQKLKRENQLLSSELAQTKKQCDDLIAFLTRGLNMEPDQINRIMNQVSSGSGHNALVGENRDGVEADPAGGDDDVDDDENEECLKLFGVWLKEKKKKRSREEKTDFSGPHGKKR